MSKTNPKEAGLALARRQFLQLGAAGLVTTTALPQAIAAPSKVKSSAKIVIAGAGAAGLSLASRLAQQLDGVQITIIDNRTQHYYQPGFTLIGAGIKTADYVVSQTASYIPAGVKWVQEKVQEIDPESNKVVTGSGQVVPYDFLFVATGLELDYEQIQGMDASLIGKHGIGSIYNGPEAASATWQLLSGFSESGGRGVFTRPNRDSKCSGAPVKYTFISEDRVVRAGTRSKTEIEYFSNNGVLFSVPIVSEKARMLFQQRDIKTHYNRILTAIDPGKRVATFTTPDGLEEQNWDFIHVVPPMKAPESVRNSPLPWQSGPWAKEGWMEVDKGTLRHLRYPNVFGVGDIAGVPKGKTAASVKWQAPVAIDHMVADITGKPSDAVYNGYTSCPMITKLGQAMLIEFDYQNNLTPSFPGVIAPLEELWISWVMKTMGLKPTYISMLRGKA